MKLPNGNITNGLRLKKTQELGAHLVFIDESGFLLIPTRRRTWGLKGRTPIIQYNFRYDRISALAALTVSAQRKHMGLYVRFQQDNFHVQDIGDFLHVLLKHLRGPIILLWDRAKIHKGPKIEKILKKNSRLYIEWFPSYAPELNPVEQIWNDFKGHTANSLPLNKQDLRIALHNNKRRVSNSQIKLKSFVLSSKLPSSPW
jgi:transposase